MLSASGRLAMTMSPAHWFALWLALTFLLAVGGSSVAVLRRRYGRRFGQVLLRPVVLRLYEARLALLRLLSAARPRGVRLLRARSSS